jgi:hypothetical protein
MNTQKPEFIEHLEHKENFFLSTLCVEGKYPIQKIDEKKLTLVWVKSEYEDNKFINFDRVYKTQQGFYIYIIRNRLNRVECDVIIYFQPEKIEELKFFVKAFINSLKN